MRFNSRQLKQAVDKAKAREQSRAGGHGRFRLTLGYTIGVIAACVVCYHYPAQLQQAGDAVRDQINAVYYGK